MVFAQALMEYGATATLAEGLTQLSFRLGHALGEWKVEVIVIVAVVAVVGRILAAVR